ncbi:hypothetical protein V491_05051, partial [Pseudogymnoascus sp. VKM F-3775]
MATYDNTQQQQVAQPQYAPAPQQQVVQQPYASQPAPVA